MNLNRTMLQDGGTSEYACGPSSCGYNGEFYCQNCGYKKGEL